MKIIPSHYQHMKAAIAAIATPAKVAAHRQFILNEGKAKDVEKRLRWDMSYYSGLTPYICDNVYSYADDTHVDTALRQIMLEVAA